jgi:hypothetical protein
MLPFTPKVKLMSQELSPSVPALLRQAIKAVPAVKYALGIGGIISVIAIVSEFGISLRVALFGTIVMLVLMTVLVIFASLAGQKSSTFHVPALVLTWFCLILAMAVAAVLFTSVFWGQPVNLRNLLGVQAESDQILLQAPPPPPDAPLPVCETKVPNEALDVLDIEELADICLE